jgi:hypothetical protein
MDAIRVLEEILEHLKSSQGDDLKSRLDDSRKPMLPEESSEEEALEQPQEEEIEDQLGKPKGIEVEKVGILGKPSEEEPSDDELEELLKKLR